MSLLPRTTLHSDSEHSWSFTQSSPGPRENTQPQQQQQISDPVGVALIFPFFLGCHRPLLGGHQSCLEGHISLFLAVTSLYKKETPALTGGIGLTGSHRWPVAWHLRHWPLCFARSPKGRPTCLQPFLGSSQWSPTSTQGRTQSQWEAQARQAAIASHGPAPTTRFANSLYSCFTCLQPPLVLLNDHQPQQKGGTSPHGRNRQYRQRRQLDRSTCR